ncbi:MAG: hypothetical protein B7Y35_00835 [Sphingomonadales bacterium 28-64-96]|nr:MAG: hypothetical protein B7Y35_00835 [Sphingomonadales bacterium 28-64-96]
MRRLVLVMLLAPGVALAQPAEAPGVLVEEAVVQADQSATVWINGLEVELAVSTGTVDHVTLNAAAAARIGLSAVTADNKADLFIGGVQQRVGRHGAGWLAAGNRLQRQQLYWFPGTDVLPLAGTIGPFALPHDRVRVEWQAGEATPYAFALIGNIDRAAYGVADLAGRPFLVGADVRMRRPLPLVTAALGSDLAESLGGRFVGEPWREEIMVGISRPVRRLELARPLVIGPLRIHAVAVRQGGPRDATVTLAPGQKPPFDAEEDPGTAQVRGRIIKRRNVARYIMLSRTQLEAHGCISLTVAKSARQFMLECGASSLPTAPLASSVPVPVQLPPAELISNVTGDDPQIQLSAQTPVNVMIAGRARSLMWGDTGAAGMILNADVARVSENLELQRLRDVLATANGAAAPRAAQNGALAGIMVALPGLLETADMQVQLGPRQALVTSNWWSGVNKVPRDGRIALEAVPATRLRVILDGNPAKAGAPAVALTLPLADRSHGHGLKGVASLPGIETMFLAIAPEGAGAAPLVSLALANDLQRLNGGRFDGPSWSKRRLDEKRQGFRLLRLNKPLVLGPLRFDEVTVALSPATAAWMRQAGLRRNEPWPDLPHITGLERELRLSPVQLAAQGCSALEIDKPGRSWRLHCAVPANASGVKP